MKCKNCGSTEDIKTIQSKGYMSCCPEREIVSTVKELTDEEMMKAEYEFLTWNRSLNNRLVEIAYELPVFQKVVAILRKAQENI